MTAAPWMKFYPRDWRGDQALRAVSIAARGLWMECLCIMHEAKPYGHLLLNGETVEGAALARMTGVPVDEVSALMAELRKAGVLSVTSKSVVFSRRMTKDHARAQKGRLSAKKRWSQVSDGVEQSVAPNGYPIRDPITQKPDTREEGKKEKLPSVAKRKPAEKGTRLPPGWKPSEINVSFAKSLGATSREIEREATRFVNYWTAKPGAGAVKLDWDATWRNWCLKSSEDGKFSGVPAAVEGVVTTAVVKPKSAPVDPKSWDEVRWRREISYARATGGWRASLGPAPGDPGCIAPTALLLPSDYALRTSEAA